MPERTQEELDAWRSKIDWLRNLPVEQWPKIEAAVLRPGCIRADQISRIETG